MYCIGGEYLWQCLLQVLSSTSVEETSALAPGSTVLIVSAPISSTLTGKTHKHRHTCTTAHTH